MLQRGFKTSIGSPSPAAVKEKMSNKVLKIFKLFIVAACMTAFSLSGQAAASLPLSPSSSDVEPLRTLRPRASDPNDPRVDQSRALFSFPNTLATSLVDPDFTTNYRRQSNRYWVILRNATASYTRLAIYWWPHGEVPQGGSADTLAHLMPGEFVTEPSSRLWRVARVAEYYVEPTLLYQFVKFGMKINDTQEAALPTFNAFGEIITHNIPTDQMTALRGVLNNVETNGVGVDTYVSYLRRRLMEVTTLELEGVSPNLREMFWGTVPYGYVLALKEYMWATMGRYDDMVTAVARTLDQEFAMDVQGAQSIGAQFQSWATDLWDEVLMDVGHHVRLGPDASFWGSYSNRTS